jgi:hypothetical protein
MTPQIPNRVPRQDSPLRDTVLGNFPEIGVSQVHLGAVQLQLQLQQISQRSQFHLKSSLQPRPHERPRVARSVDLGSKMVAVCCPPEPQVPDLQLRLGGIQRNQTRRCCNGCSYSSSCTLAIIFIHTEASFSPWGGAASEGTELEGVAADAVCPGRWRRNSSLLKPPSPVGALEDPASTLT